MKIFPKKSSICHQIPITDCPQSLWAPLGRGIQPHAWTEPFTFSIASPLPHLLQFFLFTQSLSPSEHAELLNSHCELPRERCHKKVPLWPPQVHTPKLQTAQQTQPEKNYLPTLLQTSLSQKKKLWIKTEFQGIFSNLSRGTDSGVTLRGCWFGSTFESLCFDSLFFSQSKHAY